MLSRAVIGAGIGAAKPTGWQRPKSRIGIPDFPHQLFLNGEQGAWYDPSDFSTMFQDSLGATPVTVIGQPVGLIRDKSGNANHATQATAASKPVLRQDAAGRYYLEFDGVDDSLQTATIDFTSTDKMSAWAGVHKVSDTAAGIIAEFGNGPVAGGFALIASGFSAATNRNNYSFRLTHATEGELWAESFTYTAPISNVLSCVYDFAGVASEDEIKPRINSTLGTILRDGAGTGTTAFTNAVLYIGRRGGTTVPHNGRIYSLIIRGVVSTTDQIVSAEQWIGQKMNITL